MPVKFTTDTVTSSHPGSKTCVIVLDFQNEFVRPGGNLHDDVADLMASSEMVQKIPHVVRVARETHALVIHSPVVMKKGGKFTDEDFDPHSYSAMEDLFVEGTWNCQFAEEVQPEGDDVVLKNRKNFSAFRGTELENLLRDRGIERLFVMGFLSNVCVEETTREASELFPDMKLYVCTDGCAAKTKQDHYTAMGSTLPFFATMITCSEAQDYISIAGPPVNGGNESKALLSRTVGSRPSVALTYRPRILALHGAQSNSDVTKLQLENLNITDEDYDIVYLNGGVEESEIHPEMAGLVYGPFYSWIDKDETKAGPSLITAVCDVVEAVKSDGPFDGIYGFSSGAVVAALVANLSRDPLLLDAVKNCTTFAKKKMTTRPSSRSSMIKQNNASRRNMSVRRMNRQGSILSGIGRQGSILHGIGGSRNNNLNFSSPLFRFVVLACPALATGLTELRRSAGINSEIEPGTIPSESFHIIGIEDGFKARSEQIAALFAHRQVMYLPGGHSVGRDAHSDKDLCGKLRTFMRSLGRPPKKRATPNYIPQSEVSSVYLLPQSQVAYVKLNNELLPEGLYKEGATIKACLGARPQAQPFLYNSRSMDKNAVTTYGDALKFIEGGAGDLRHIGVKAGEVVAYVAPPGGGAAAALAFLSIGAQTAAAPLAMGTAEPDALDALDQFNAKHLILFEGLDAPGCKAAFEIFASSGKAKIHMASIGNTDSRAGHFEYIDSKGVDGAEPLVNSEDGICLLLRTSGTTARPKGVPLEQGALVTNGAILAKSMQLTEFDVCYSVMPLFHIGGISASILCTLASGGSASCDSEPFSPDRMVDALAKSNPQPTWYSSVPTIHNATVNFIKNAAAGDPKYEQYGIDKEGIWTKGHSLRMIRSGAAALLGPDGAALAATYGGVPIYPTYSMSEQMPISQPPAGKIDTLTDKPGSVGVPVAASTAIVSRGTYRPQPHGLEGEIAICGPTVLNRYLANPTADQKAYFLLSLPEEINPLPFFLTGDVGLIDSDGFLSLKGRAKELIKKGGEQVSPFEVEEPLLDHPWVQTPVCFAVPSKLYGEEVGCALILSPRAPTDDDPLVLKKKVVAEMRSWMKQAKMAPAKWPTKWIIVDDDQLPKTKTKKYIRIGLSTKLGLDPEEEKETDVAKKQNTAKVDWGVIAGFRFLLACYVMFMHIGNEKSWGHFNNLRGWPWHVHVFFTLGGYSMASPMNPTISKKFSYFMARIGAMYPMYALALLFGLINLLVVCRPSTFSKNFHWDGQPNDLYLEDGSVAPYFCEGTPATPNSYWGSLFLTLITYVFGLAVTPFWPISWWMGYYLWFSSMYYMCLACFPATYNYFFNKTRKQSHLLLIIMIGLQILNYVIIMAGWFGFKDGEGYSHYNATGNANDPDDYTDGVNQNAGVLSFYLFGPFWMVYFIIGVCAAFLYDAYRPAEKHHAHRWGWVADAITLVMIGLSVAIAMQPVTKYGEFTREMYMRPDEANHYTDSGSSGRLWDNLGARIFAPVTTLWIFALSTGEGVTAMILRTGFVVEVLAPNAYNCFLFHQMIGQWYYAATRQIFWNWWRFRKSFYWFSPKPCPVEWYEYFYVVGLVVWFSSVMTKLEPIVGEALSKLKGLFIEEEEDDDEETSKVLFDIIEGMTGIEPMLDYTLEECGLASIGVPMLVGLLNKNFSKKKRRLNISASDLVSAKTIGDMVEVVDSAKALADAQGV